MTILIFPSPWTAMHWYFNSYFSMNVQHWKYIGDYLLYLTADNEVSTVRVIHRHLRRTLTDPDPYTRTVRQLSIIANLHSLQTISTEAWISRSKAWKLEPSFSNTCFPRSNPREVQERMYPLTLTHLRMYCLRTERFHNVSPPRYLQWSHSTFPNWVELIRAEVPLGGDKSDILDSSFSSVVSG